MKISTNCIGALMGGAAMLIGFCSAQAAPHAKVSAARANAIVLHRYPGKLTSKTTLENEEGHWQYGVMVRSGHTLREVMVDANTGKIASVEVTSAGKERVEAQQEAAAKAKGAKKTPVTGEAKAQEKGEKEGTSDEKDGAEESGDKN